jgi:hypothetical protein
MVQVMGTKMMRKGRVLRFDLCHTSFKKCIHIFLASNAHLAVSMHFTTKFYSKCTLGSGSFVITTSGDPFVVEFGLSLSFCAFFSLLFTAHWYSGTTPANAE